MDKEKLSKLLAELKNKEVWDIRMDTSLGSIFSFEVGERIKIVKTGREYEGEYTFMIYCSYRILYKNKKLIISSRAGENQFNRLKHVLSELNGLKVIETELSNTMDLKITFSKGITLEVINDIYSSHVFDTNWFFRVGKQYYSVNDKLSIIIENDTNKS